MLKKYFEDESYNIMPCGVVAFQNDSTLKIISANDYYYSTYANGNFESLNICEEDKNIIADLKDKNEVVYKCIVSDGTIRYICMRLTKYNENDILGILMDVTEQHTNFVRMKDERRCFTFALKSSKNIVFEHNVADDNMTLYIPVKGQTELKKLSIPNNTVDAVYELVDKRDYGYLKENIFNEKVENISVRMKLPGDKNYEWHRIFRNFEHDEEGNLERVFGTITNIEDEKHHEKELKEKIEAEQEQEDFQSKLANEMHEYEQFSIRHFFEQVLEGELCVTEIYDEAAKWSLDLSASCYNLLFLYVQQEKENGSEREMNTFVHRQEEILQYFLRFPQYILFRWNVNCYGVLVKCDAEEMEDYTQRAIAQIQMNCESQNANADWYVVVGTPVERLSMLKECYDRVNHYGAYRFLYPQMHVLSEETLKSYLPAQDDTRIAEVDATKMSPEIISEFLAKGSSKEVYNFVESYLQSISEVIHSVIFRDYVVLNIRFTAIAFMERNGVTKEEFLAHIGKYGTNVHVQQDEVFEYFLSILQTAIDLRDEQNTNLSSKTLKKALAYIDEHYTSENLSLGTVACEVQVGANYLSSVFSQNMQKTFTEYISEKRMEKAKKLLKSTELPTSEIAAQVGYKDPHYFSFVFKKTQGCSPREYRSSI